MPPKTDWQKEAEKMEKGRREGSISEEEMARMVMNGPSGSMFIFQHHEGTAEYVPPAKKKKKGE